MAALSRSKIRYWIRLNAENHSLTSPEDDQYNCIAWAYDRTTDELLWPNRRDHSWPAHVPTDPQDDLQSLVNLFESIGYLRSPTPDLSLEDTWEKLVIYGDDAGPTHAAIQLDSGKWSSKMGVAWEDISHDTPDDLSGTPGYGTVQVVLRRLRTPDGDDEDEAVL